MMKNDRKTYLVSNLSNRFLIRKMEDDLSLFFHQPSLVLSVSTDLAPFSLLFLKIKKKLAGDILTLESCKKAWDEVATLVEDDFSMAFQKWLERHGKCIRYRGTYVEKS